MRTLLFASIAGLGLAFASPALAQHASHHGGGQWHGASRGQWNWSGGRWNWQGGQWRTRHDWGGSVGGRWIGGARAPGGWSAYRRPVKGWALPGYWLEPSFAISDWGAYGLAPPPDGSHWSRYYDDAVLVDQYGRTMDCVADVDWDGDAPDGYADHGDRAYDYGHDVGPGAPYPPPPPGVMPPPPPGARVETRTYAYEGAPPVVVHSGPDCGCVGTAAGGWYYPPATTTTVTITSVPVTTTTTRTVYVEEAAPAVHYRTKIIKRAAPRRPSKIVRRYHNKIIKR